MARNHIARLNADGTLDTNFLNGLAGADNDVLCIYAQTNGAVLIGGKFSTVNGTPCGGIARLNPDGTLDTTYTNGLSGADGEVDTITVQSDGKILLGGNFTHFNGIACGHVARLDSGGVLDPSFASGLAVANGQVLCLALQGDGSIILCGDFASVNGILRGQIARLDPDGTLDPAFGSGVAVTDGILWHTTLQNDGKIILAGSFHRLGGFSHLSIARLNADGSLDPGFDNGHTGLRGFNCWVLSLAVQPDGKIIIGGSFTNDTDTAKNRIARLNPDGSLDTHFGAGLNGADGNVSAVALQSDQKFLWDEVSGTCRVFRAVA